MRCPLILRGPGIPKGKSNESLTYVHDLYATLLDLSGVHKPEGIDSRSLTPILQGESQNVRDSLFLPFQDNQRAVQDGRYKLHVYPKINHQLLFDLASDPHEMTNLVADPKHAEQLKSMRAMMESWRTRLHDPHPLSVANPSPKKPEYDNRKRVLDRWQPEWIRKKYFGEHKATERGKRIKSKSNGQ